MLTQDKTSRDRLLNNLPYLSLLHLVNGLEDYLSDIQTLLKTDKTNIASLSVPARELPVESRAKDHERYFTFTNNDKTYFAQHGSITAYQNFCRCQICKEQQKIRSKKNTEIRKKKDLIEAKQKTKVESSWKNNRKVEAVVDISQIIDSIVKKPTKKPQITKHNSMGYWRGCRCEICREAGYEARCKQAKEKGLPLPVKRVTKVREIITKEGFEHAAKGYAAGCGCEICKTAMRERKIRQRSNSKLKLKEL